MAKIYKADFNAVIDKGFKGWKTQMKNYIVKKTQAKVDEDGPVLRKRTGRLWRWLKDLAQEHSDGFSIANQAHGKAWEEGFDRPAYDTVLKGKKVHVPAQTFPPRKYMEPTIMEEKDYMERELQLVVEGAFKTCFPDKTVEVTVGTK